MYKGIDYGMGKTNIDNANGIRYGVISQHEVLQAWADTSEANYNCADCGDWDLAQEDNTGNWFIVQDGENIAGPFDTEEDARDYAENHKDEIMPCDMCEPTSYYVDDDEYQAEAGQDGDIFITKSPYYTICQLCSPCAPGAGYIINMCEDGYKAYCFGHDWFEDGKAPYPVYRVSDNTLVKS